MYVCMYICMYLRIFFNMWFIACSITVVILQALQQLSYDNVIILTTTNTH